MAILSYLFSAALVAVAFLVIVEVLALASIAPFLRARSKIHFYLYAILFWFTTKDYGSAPGATASVPTGTPDCVKTFVFVRHGQSSWNSIFNTFDLGWPMRTLYAVASEVALLFLNENESSFADAPLSLKGVVQARKAAPVITAKDLHKTAKSYLLVTSNLRRSIETAILALSGLGVSDGSRKIVSHSALQEISRNVDALSLSREPGDPPRSLSLATMKFPVFMKVMDFKHNTGNKPTHVTGASRVQEFTEWAFRQPEEVIYVVGHSGWMKTFFKRYVAPEHKARVTYTSKKIKNCGVVSFQVAEYRNPGKPSTFVVLPDSLDAWN